MKPTYLKQFVSILFIFTFSLIYAGCLSVNTSKDKGVTGTEKIGDAEVKEITVKYDGNQIVLKPIVGDNCLMVPGKEFVEFLGLFADWDSEKNTLGISDGVTPAAVQEGNVKANVNGKMALLEAAPVMRQGKLFVPMSFIIDTFGFIADFDDGSATLTIAMNGRGTAALPSSDVKNVDGTIVGFWSTIQNFHGQLVDITTGISQGGTYSGEWYLFKEDGTYQYIIIGSGAIISGSAIRTGMYSTSGNRIKLYDNKETWYPDISRSDQKESYKNKPVDNEVGEFTLKDGGETLVLELDFTTRLNKVSD